MSCRFSQMSVPPSSPAPGYGSPPPGYGVPPPPKKNTAQIVLIVLAAVFGVGIFFVAILAAILFPVFQKVRGNARLAASESNVKLIELGMIQYTADHNDRMPPAASYKNALFPSYIKDETVFHSPGDKEGAGSYAMNVNLQGKSLENLAHSDTVVSIYEGHNQTLSFQHDGKAVVGFADGHVRALTQAQAQKFTQMQVLRWKP